MKVKNKKEDKIVEIYTADNPSNIIIPPDKEHYLTIILPYSVENYNYIKRNRIAYYGIMHFIDEDEEDKRNNSAKIVITVTGKKNIINVIDVILSENDNYPHDANDDLIQRLNAYKILCEKNKKEVKNHIPENAVDTNSLKDESDPQFEERTKNSKRAIRIVSDKDDISYVYKENLTERAGSEFEAFNGDCMRLLLGRRHPKIKSVHSNGKRVAVISEFIKCISYYDLYPELYEKGDTSKRPSKKELLKSKFMDVVVACYVEEENDLHGNNYGLDANGICIKYDDDQATWSITAKYLFTNPLHGNPTFEFYPPVTVFKVTANDIISLPLLIDAKPKNWPTISDSQLFEHAAELVQEKKAIKDKYYMFLKRILIPDAVYDELADANFTSKNKKMMATSNKKNKTKLLREVLLTMPEFQKFLKSTKKDKLLDRLMKDFKAYNEDTSYGKVDINNIKKEYEKILSAIEIKKVSHQGFFKNKILPSLSRKKETKLSLTFEKK